jgi:multicomponent Na+:H+ antiporter subunit D
VRITYDVYGVDLVHALGLGLPLTVAASTTIVYGSLRALQQGDIKRRLAYSTISQVSYIVLGTSLLGPYAAIGGLVHLVHQGLMKITMFFCAGALAESIGVTRIAQLDGAGRRMPLTMAAFSVAALGMIGIPPIAGFVSKWYLGVGSIQAGEAWVLLVLAASSLLNAAYFLPLLHRAWLRSPPEDAEIPPFGREASAGLVGPLLLTALFVVAAGALAGLEFSPLGWASFIVEETYVR